MDRQAMTNRSSGNTRRNEWARASAFPDTTDARVAPEARVEPLPPNSSAPFDTPGRRHMGTATSDPNYLPPVSGGRGGRDGVRGPAHVPTPVDQRAPLHYDRYIEKPKHSKTIFTSRYERSRRNRRILLLLAILAIVAVVIVWVVVLR